MSEPITVTHTHGERVTVAAADVELFAYVYRPDPEAFESRKPYAHPLRTLAGDPVTGYRPNDHRWHKGLQLTASHLSGQNFWGGNCYVHGKGYVRLPERVGSMRHDGFDAFDVAGDALRFVEKLTWLNNSGDRWAEERREIRVHSVDTADGSWALDWTSAITNRREVPLSFGSPTTAGREMAGYTGLNWRGARDFTDGEVLSPAGTGEDMMGRQAPWLAYVGKRDEADRYSTVLFVHAPGNAGHPFHWFVRTQKTPLVALSWAFFAEFELQPGETFASAYRIVVADGAWDSDRVAGYLKSHPFSDAAS